MKSITLSADEKLIELARNRARSEHTTLNTEFRRWLESYTSRDQIVHQAQSAMQELRGKVRIGRKLSHQEMNER